MKIQSIAPALDQRTGLLDELNEMVIYLHIEGVTLLSSGGQYHLHPHCYLKIGEIVKTANNSKYIVKCQSPVSSNVLHIKLEWMIDQKVSIGAPIIYLRIMKSRRVISDQTIMTIPVPVIDILSHLINSDSACSINAGPGYTLTMDIKKSSLQDILDHLTLSDPLVQSLHDAQQPIDMILTTGSALGEFHPAIRTASTLLSQLFSKLQTNKLTFSQVVQLAEHVNRVFSIVSQIQSVPHYSHDIKIVIASVFNSLAQVIELILFLHNSITKDEIHKHLGFSKENESITQALSDLDDTITNLERILEVDLSQRQMTESLKANLKVLLHPVQFVQGVPCLSGTRQKTLQNIQDWTVDKYSKILWLHGIAGTGKSTVAESVFRSLSQTKNLGAYFTCRRDETSLSNTLNVLPTISYQLGIANPSYGQALLQVSKDDPSFEMSLGYVVTQCSKLFTETMQSHSLIHVLEGFKVIVIDALDELNSKKDQVALLSALLNLVESCTWVKVLVASRKLPYIADFM
ncbi:hypothetical protein BDN72DRAFT_927413, partial [Pluteus cervinus]